MGSLIRNLKNLENNGIVLPVLPGQACKGILNAVAGDILGSHSIGAFLDNLSLSVNFCRYCEIERNTFQADPLCRSTSHTVESYREHVSRLQSIVEVSNLTPCSMSCSSFMYVSLDCLHHGHDLFKGTVASDLMSEATFRDVIQISKQFIYQENPV